MSQPMMLTTAENIFYKLFEPHPMIVEDLIAGGLTVLAGTPKIGKSWLALDLALSVAEGVGFLGKPVHKTGVLYFCLEDTYLRVRNRMHELVDEPPENLYLTTTSERIGSGFTRDIVNFLREHRDMTFFERVGFLTGLTPVSVIHSASGSPVITKVFQSQKYRHN